MIYSIYGLARPVFAPVKIGTGADIAIGISNGMLGGLTGLGGVISTISCQWRGWPKDVQRAVFQPVLFVAFVVISITQAIAGSITRDTLTLYAWGVPFMAAGLWSGFRLFGKIDDETFRKTVLVLLLAGMSLIFTAPTAAADSPNH
ncbi:TSUP family transporter [Bradyrhizobium jicamae]|uniref:TSUP family transporter n=1 Tax=Bradyrhizobium jicamae TaxID=280332 RepID=UPI00201256C5|nr:TSUP family transporter [Bradyrhizobium jicamae]